MIPAITSPSRLVPPTPTGLGRPAEQLLRQRQAIPSPASAHSAAAGDTGRGLHSVTVTFKFVTVALIQCRNAQGLEPNRLTRVRCGPRPGPPCHGHDRPGSGTGGRPAVLAVPGSTAGRTQIRTWRDAVMTP
jgi:hypothetical protein